MPVHDIFCQTEQSQKSDTPRYNGFVIRKKRSQTQYLCRRDPWVQQEQPKRKDVKVEPIFTEARQWGEELLRELDAIVDELALRLPDVSFRIEDRYGVLVRGRRANGSEDLPPALWPAEPITAQRRTFGVLRTAKTLSPHQRSGLTEPLLRLALNLTELLTWAETEAERRGEKIQRLLQSGLTQEVQQLLQLCGLFDTGPFVLVSMDLKDHRAPFQHMDVLRKFMLAHIWGYRSKFDFLAYRPNGLTGIFVSRDPDNWSRQGKALYESWRNYRPDLGLLIVVSSTPSLSDLSVTLKETELLLRFAARSELQGVIPPLFHRRISRVLAQLSPEALHTLVEDTLGPLLLPEHSHLLETLRMYLFLGQGTSQTADALFIHRNTLMYRLRQIEQILGVQLRRIEDVSAIWTALQAAELLAMTE